MAMAELPSVTINYTTSLYGFLGQLFYFRGKTNKQKQNKTRQSFSTYVKLKAKLKISPCYMLVFKKYGDSPCENQSPNFTFVLSFSLVYIVFGCQRIWAWLGLGEIYFDNCRWVLILS